jgi:hypothetical protein
MKVNKTYIGEKTTFSINAAVLKTGATDKRLKLDQYLSRYTKINSKWIKYLNAKPKTLKLLQEKRYTLEDIHISNGFLNRVPVAQEIRPSFFTSKEIITGMMR